VIGKFSISALLCLFLLSCAKEDLVPVAGFISDPNQSMPVGGVKVELWTQQIEDGIFAANYVLAGTDTTGSDGKFQFAIEKKQFTGMYLIISKTGYFGYQAEIKVEKVNSDNSYNADYQLLPKAMIQVRIKNSAPFNSADYFEFRILNGFTGCQDCCKGDKYQFYGMDVDQTVDCQTIGHQFIQIQWLKRRNGEQTTNTERFFVNAFETTGIDFNF
jgi:hypothetical protein